MIFYLREVDFFQVDTPYITIIHGAVINHPVVGIRCHGELGSTWHIGRCFSPRKFGARWNIKVIQDIVLNHTGNFGERNLFHMFDKETTPYINKDVPTPAGGKRSPFMKLAKGGNAYDKLMAGLKMTGKADYDKIIASGELVIGYTIFAPIAYEDGNELVGFDIDLAKAVCAKLGIEAKFQIINWNSKVFELNSGAIDVIWNGMTITDEIKEATSVTIAYLKNKQVAVIRVEDETKYTSLDSMKDATICVEAGSAGQLCVVKGE